jgi:hypothetical protein
VDRKISGRNIQVLKICGGKGIGCARRLPRHANISTAQRYMYLDERELAEAQDLAK